MTTTMPSFCPMPLFWALISARENGQLLPFVGRVFYLSCAVRGGGTLSRSQVHVGEGRVWRPVDDGTAPPRGHYGGDERRGRGVPDEGQLSEHQGEGRAAECVRVFT